MMDGQGNGAALPLAGIRVLDFTQVMMGPCCTQMLGDYGADVIKIERPGLGDLSRWSLGEDPDGGNNPVFCSLNRNKRSVALDMKSDEGRNAVMALAGSADVIVNNFRPGVMERMGLGYAALRARNPRIIYAIGTGFGTEGPYAGKGGQDVLAQAMSGVMHRPCQPRSPALHLSDGARRLLCGNASHAGDPAGAPAAGEDRRGAVAYRFRSTTRCSPCRCRRRRPG